VSGNIIIIKLGGSLITEKNKPFSIRKKIIENSVKQIIDANKKIILVHGGGSFGHPIAKKYGIMGGHQPSIQNQIFGLAKTHASMEELNSYIINAFLNQNYPAISFQASSIFLKRFTGGFSNFLKPIQLSMDFGIIPVLYGDIILDNDGSFSIISGDQIIYELCKNLKSYHISQVIFAFEQDGLYIKTKERNRELAKKLYVEELNHIQLADLREKIDVTGSIRNKLTVIKDICNLGIPVKLINGLFDYNILKALKQENLSCTSILPPKQQDFSKIEQRKIDHLIIPLKYNVQHKKNYLKYIHLIHHSLPEINLEEIKLNLNFFGKRINAPICIAAMTGGTKISKKINEILAFSAEKEKIIMSVGSQRIGLSNPNACESFEIVRQVAPTIPIIGNLGISQISDPKFKIEDFQKCIDMIQADVMAIHFNALHELIQKEGNLSFKTFRDKFAKIRESFDIPIIAKEVGNGFNKDIAEILDSMGFDGFDVGGAGGTNFTAIESFRPDPHSEVTLTREAGTVFRDWGIPTPASIINIRSTTDKLIIATGGLKSGMDIAKCISIGADIGGFAYNFLTTSWKDFEGNIYSNTLNEINTLKTELRSVCWLLNISDISKLKNNKSKRIIRDKLKNWLENPDF